MPLAGSSDEFGSCLSSGTTGELQMMAEERGRREEGRGGKEVERRGGEEKKGRKGG